MTHWHRQGEHKSSLNNTKAAKNLSLTSAIKQENREERTPQEVCVSEGQSPDLVLGLTPVLWPQYTHNKKGKSSVPTTVSLTT